RHDIRCITPDDANDPATSALIAESRPDFLFSFYYRQMLSPAVLASAPRGAFNMHGSLLPRFRGRVPVNWAVIRGARETGATLHEMVEKPDAGRIVDQQAVPILPDDTAGDVFDKVTVAAELVLYRALPALVEGRAELRPQDLAQGSYFGGRRPEDGRIRWSESAQSIHDLVRGVAPPYPGAFTEIDGCRLRILRTQLAPRRRPHSALPGLHVENARLYASCGDGNSLQLLEVEVDGALITAEALARRFGPSIALPT
ncbi:MAG: formyltransferase, partial [Rhodocyclaceae bacterium]